MSLNMFVKLHLYVCGRCKSTFRNGGRSLFEPSAQRN